VVSPRLALTADVAPGSRVRLSGGLFTQSPGYEKLLQSDYFVDLSNADALHLRSERAWHAVGGWEQTLTPELVVRAEGYYKRFDRLILGRLETTEEVSARVSGYDFPGAFASSVPTDATITGIPGNIGSGIAYGVDFYAAKKALSASTRLTGWVSYTVGKAETTAYGVRYAADYDRLHALSVVANYRWSRLIELATTVRAQSGFPYTPPSGVRVAGAEDLTDHDGDGNITELVPRLDEQGLPIWSVAYGGVDRLNTAHVPVFARADIRLTFRPQWQGGRWQLYVEVSTLSSSTTGHPIGRKSRWSAARRYRGCHRLDCDSGSSRLFNGAVAPSTDRSSTPSTPGKKRRAGRCRSRRPYRRQRRSRRARRRRRAASRWCC
jgi:hypothetical protein